MSSPRVRIAPEVEAREAASGDIFNTIPPPFDITSDMLLAGGSCPIEPLRRSYPDVPFLSVNGRALLGVWFARILEIRAGRNGRIRIGPHEDPANLPYQELNVAVLLRDKRLFVPGIYATSELTLRLGHRYGMPKQPTLMEYRSSEAEVNSRAAVHGAVSHVAARPVAGGRPLAALLDSILPWWSWPVLFPSGSYIEGLIEGVALPRLVWISEGHLALDEPWLPHPARLWRPALHLPRQKMKLPAPETREGGTGPPTAR